MNNFLIINILAPFFFCFTWHVKCVKLKILLWIYLFISICAIVLETIKWHLLIIIRSMIFQRVREKKKKDEKAPRDFIDTSISLKRSLPSSWYIASGYISSGPPEMSNISLWSNLRAGDHDGGQRWGGFNISPGREREALSAEDSPSFLLASVHLEKWRDIKAQVTDSADI